MLPASIDFFNLSFASSTSFNKAVSPLPLSSFNAFSAWYTKESALFLISNSSFLALSSAACASASLTMRSISSSFNPLEEVIVIFCSF